MRVKPLCVKLEFSVLRRGKALRLALVPTCPTVQWVLGTLSPGIKRLGREAAHSFPPSVKIKNVGAISPFHGIVRN
jgi:hypothetical protein